MSPLFIKIALAYFVSVSPKGLFPHEVWQSEAAGSCRDSMRSLGWISGPAEEVNYELLGAYVDQLVAVAPDNTMAPCVADELGYEALTRVLNDALSQAAHGKGAERHANDLPFHEQRMQTISKALESDKGMAFQVIKKLTEGLQLDHDRREKELLGAIVYLAGIVIYYRKEQRV